MASGFPSVANGRSLAQAIVMYFGIVGLISGYHFIRIYAGHRYFGARMRSVAGNGSDLDEVWLPSSTM